MNSSSSRFAKGDGFFFGGQSHETVPRKLLTDRRLTPLERNAWQVFRLYLDREGVTSVPTYEQLRDFLSSMPGARASTETVARVITILRLTRWLTLVKCRRDTQSGQIIGNVYILHDDPLTPYEAIQIEASHETMKIEAGYLALVCEAMEHPSKAVRLVAKRVLAEITEDPWLKSRSLPSRVELQLRQFAAQAESEVKGREKALSASSPGKLVKTPASDTSLSTSDASRLPSDTSLPTSDSEAARKPAPIGSLRNPKPDSTSTVFCKVRTKEEVQDAARQEAREALRLPKRFTQMKASQQQSAHALLAGVDPLQQQAVLDEWDARCSEGQGKIQNPAGYLCGIIQRAIRGEFTLWAASKKAGVHTAMNEPKPIEQERATTFQRASPELVDRCAARLKAIYRGAG
jgi:hypothetical protein